MQAPDDGFRNYEINLPPDACLVWTWWHAGLEATTLVTWDLADGKQPPLDLARLQIFARIAMFCLNPDVFVISDSRLLRKRCRTPLI